VTQRYSTTICLRLFGYSARSAPNEHYHWAVAAAILKRRLSEIGDNCSVVSDQSQWL